LNQNQTATTRTTTPLPLVAAEDEEDCIQADLDFLWQEQAKYHDLLEITMTEHYRLLPKKLIPLKHQKTSHIMVFLIKLWY
jgi:hypothetical protein